MCIAIVSEYGVGLPSNNVMKRCWRSNSDGAGYAYLTTEDEWHVKKGFKKWKDFITAFRAEEFTNECTVIIHFRVGTSGAMPGGVCSPDCTHPFPISDEEDMLNKHEYTEKNIAMHNGVHSRPKGPLSDSQVAVRDIAAPLIPYFDDPKIRGLCADLLHGIYENNNRWFVANGPLYYFIGDWITDKETSIIYSNDGYRPYIPKPIERGMSVLSQWMGAISKSSPGTIFCPLPDMSAFTFSTDGVWDWDKWDKFNKDTEPEVKTKALVVIDKEGNVDDGITALYDATGNIIGLVDKDGDIIWDDVIVEMVTPEGTDLDDGWKCPDCDAIQTVGDLIEGKCMYCRNEHSVKCPECGGSVFHMKDNNCPWCYTYIKNSKSEGRSPCPACTETSWLCASTFDIADSECLRCGCLYDEDIVGPKAIVAWNQDTKKYHEDFLRVIMDEKGDQENSPDEPRRRQANGCK